MTLLIVPVFLVLLILLIFYIFDLHLSIKTTSNIGETNNDSLATENDTSEETSEETDDELVDTSTGFGTDISGFDINDISGINIDDLSQFSRDDLMAIVTTMVNTEVNINPTESEITEPEEPISDLEEIIRNFKNSYNDHSHSINRDSSGIRLPLFSRGSRFSNIAACYEPGVNEGNPAGMPSNAIECATNNVNDWEKCSEACINNPGCWAFVTYDPTKGRVDDLGGEEAATYKAWLCMGDPQNLEEVLDGREAEGDNYVFPEGVRGVGTGDNQYNMYNSFAKSGYDVWIPNSKFNMSNTNNQYNNSSETEEVVNDDSGETDE